MAAPPSSSLFLFFLFSIILNCAFATVFLHNPRGSNNRLNENDIELASARRLFDSENNVRGGYCWGPALSYVEGSILPIEWTSLFGGSNPSASLTHVIQYMCTGSQDTDTVRDGTSTERIPLSNDPSAGREYYNYNISGEYVFGMHESNSYQKACESRQRNKGLFSGTVSISNTAGSMNTRQNPGGNRFGFECSEEKAYYPYWHPAPWKDIAVVTDQPSNCQFYQSESQNVKPKNYCSGTSYSAMGANNQVDCTNAGGTWTTSPAFGIPAPDCVEPSNLPQLSNLDRYTRMQRYQWKVPTSNVEPCITNGGCNCAIRIRYNVTSVESNGLFGQFPDSRSNFVTPLKADPIVNITAIGKLQLAIEPRQTGRVFQDRSFTFHISPRSASYANAKIYNLNVRGKRGAVAQAFPATEYAFSPEILKIEVGDYVHFQWTGCDTNPMSFAGRGRSGTDRSNIVQIESLDHNVPMTGTISNPLFPNVDIRKRMSYLNQTNCATNPSGPTDPANCQLLNAAGPKFDGGIVRMEQQGSFYYMSTRNNNIGNRFHKGSILVYPVGSVPTDSPSSGFPSTTSSDSSDSSSTTTSSSSSSPSGASSSSPVGNAATSSTQLGWIGLLSVFAALLLVC